jgi:hypothetical protein
MAQLFIDLSVGLEIWWVGVPCSGLFDELMQVKFR